jgi:biopolymer transport protein ExbB/TolQ
MPMERRLRGLAWLAAGGPFVGLIGAVVGMHTAFEAIGALTPAEATRAGLWTTVLVVLTFHGIAGVVVLLCRSRRKP